VTLVIDASVAIKWFFQNKPGEQDAKQALGVLRALQDGKIDAIQPPHWLVEVMSVLAREAPPFAEEALEVLEALELPISIETGAYRLGVRLSRQLRHHTFDTLYHATALEHGATLITADDNYFAKAFRLGNIKLLTTFSAS
jgi:predicted nucleic acid-binding protein